MTILLTITNVSSGAIALTSSGTLTRLLRYTIEEQTTALSMAPVGVVNEFFFVHQFITWYSDTVCGRLFTTSSLQF